MTDGITEALDGDQQLEADLVTLVAKRVRAAELCNALMASAALGLGPTGDPNWDDESDRCCSNGARRRRGCVDDGT